VASSVPKSKETSIQKRSEAGEENRIARRLRAAKKEEESSVNLSKKIQQQEDPISNHQFCIHSFLTLAALFAFSPKTAR
jgi:hypothetical protein